jgi:hypothetical protein
MSPELALISALGVDTRTDAYSLGVLQHELLVGELPFDERVSNMEEMASCRSASAGARRRSPARAARWPTMQRCVARTRVGAD